MSPARLCSASSRYTPARLVAMPGHTYDVESSPIGDIFKEDRVVFQIPEFQRRYAWTPAEVGALVADLFEDCDWSTKTNEFDKYFLGSIVLARDQAVLLVLDGQQRLTTIALLLAVLYNELKQHGYK